MHFFSRPRRALVSSLLTAAATGSFYGFSVYSEALKKQFNLTQQQLANINTLPYAFGFVGPMSGWVTHKFGPGAATLLGGILQCTGQLCMFLVANKNWLVPNPPWALVGTAFITFAGMQLNSGAAFTTPVLHYPQQRASVTALVKAYVGLSGAIVTQAFVLLYGTPGSDPEALKCLLLWAATTASCCSVSTFIVPRRPDKTDEEPVDVLRVVFVLIAFLGVFATAVSLLPSAGDYVGLHDVGVILMIGLALAPVPASFAPCLDRPSGSSNGQLRNHGKKPQAPPTTTAATTATTAATTTAAKRVYENPTSFTLGQMLRTADAWIICYIGVVVVGGGTVLGTNLAQIADSAGAGHRIIPTLVTLFSTGNLLGRLLSMGLSDAVVRSGRSRADFLIVIVIIMCASHAGFLAAAAASRPASNLQYALLVLSASGGGIAFGAIWPHFVVLASEIFGSAHLPILYMFYDGVCGALGSLVFANAIPSAIYDASAVGNVCTGSVCFGPTHALIAALCAVGAVASAILSARTASLYAQISGTHVHSLV